MNWADFLNSVSDAVVWLDWYPTLWLLNAGGGPLQLCFLFIFAKCGYGSSKNEC